MERRYEAYKDVVVRPFFREHFARLDRQIVLVDALAALQRRARCGARSRRRARRDPRLLPHRAAHAAEPARPPAHRPHPVRRHQGRSPAPPQSRPARGDPAPHGRARGGARHAGRRDDRRDRARGGAGDPRGAGAARAANCCRRSSACRWRANTPAAPTFDGETEVAMFPGDLPDDPEALFRADDGGLSRPHHGRVRRRGFSLPALAPAPARTSTDDGVAGPAPYPARSRAAIPDRRPARMTRAPTQARRVSARRSGRGGDGRRRSARAAPHRAWSRPSRSRRCRCRSRPRPAAAAPLALGHDVLVGLRRARAARASASASRTWYRGPVRATRAGSAIWALCSSALAVARAPGRHRPRDAWALRGSRPSRSCARARRRRWSATTAPKAARSCANCSRSSAQRRGSRTPAPASKAISTEIIDGADLIRLAERELMAPLDARGAPAGLECRQARLARHRGEPARRRRYVVRPVHRALAHAPAGAPLWQPARARSA